MPRRALRTIVALCALTGWGAAHAAPPKKGPPEPAQTLFDTGVADMAKGLFDKACPAIEASQRMSPMPGTLFTLAECEAKRGRLATAMRYYSEYLVLYRAFSAQKKNEQRERAKISEAQLKKLDAVVPRLTLRLASDDGKDVTVKRDGEIVAELSLGTPTPVDPGEHLVTTDVPGGSEVQHRITLGERESKTLELTVNRKPPAPPPTVSVTAAPVPPPSPDVRPFVIGIWTAGAIGVIGIGVGTVTGILALDQAALADRLCKPPSPNGTVYCDGDGYAAASRFDTLGTISTAGFAVGGLGLGVGLILFLSKPSSPTSSPNVGAGKSAMVQSGVMESVTVVPFVSPQLMGLSLTGKF